MDSQEAEFEVYLMVQLKLELDKATKETEKVLKEKVQSNVYNSYTPGLYVRTYDLKNSITSKSNGIEGEVIFDEGMLGHTNAYGQNTKLVPQYINYGHVDDTGIDNMYHQHPSRHFVEDTISEMQNNDEYRDLFKFKVVK